MSGCFRVKVFCDLCNRGRVLFFQFDYMDGIPKPFQVPGSAEISQKLFCVHFYLRLKPIVHNVQQSGGGNAVPGKLVR